MRVNKIISALVISGLLMPLQVPPYFLSEAVAEESTTVPMSTTAPVINTAAPVGVFVTNAAAVAAVIASQNVINGILGVAPSTPPFSSNPTPPAAPPPPPAPVSPAPIISSSVPSSPAPPAPPPPSTVVITANYNVNGDLISSDPIIVQMGMGDPLPPLPGDPVITPMPSVSPPVITFDPNTGNITLTTPPLTVPPPAPTIFDILGIPPPTPPVTIPPQPTIFDVLGIPPPTPPTLVVPVVVAPLPPTEPAIVVTTMPEDMTPPIFSEE